MRRLSLVFVVIAAASCKQGEGERCQVQGDCESGLVCNRSTNTCQPIAGGVDGQITPDAAVDGGPQIDAMIDAVPSSTVTVTSGACVGGADYQLTVAAGPVFQQVGGGPPNPTINLTVGDKLEFSTTGMHNFESAPGTASQFTFESNPVVSGGHTACLTFTAATPSAIMYQCDMHPVAMNGMLDVN